MKNKLGESKHKELVEELNQLNAKEFLDVIYDNLETRAIEMKHRTVNTLEFEEQLILALQLLWG